MRHRRHLIVLILSAAVTAATLTACGAGDSGDTGGPEASTPATTAVDPKVDEAVDAYEAYVRDQAGQARVKTKVMTDAIRAGDLQAARAAYAPSRQPWERIEPVAGLVEELDGRLDSRVDNVAGVDDPGFTGWHRLEYLMFEKNTLDGAGPVADQLDADLATLDEQLAVLEIPPAQVPVGASELIEEAANGKITGEEDRYSKTDLWDLAGNVEGSKHAITLLAPALAEKDPELLAEINSQFADVETTLAPLRQGDGYVLYCVEADEYPSALCTATTIDAPTRDRLKSQLAALSESTAEVSGALGLQ